MCKFSGEDAETGGEVRFARSRGRRSHTAQNGLR